MVDDAILYYERAHALPARACKCQRRFLSWPRMHLDPSPSSPSPDVHHGIVAPEVVFGPLALLLLDIGR
jgi:hypothetical protein